MNENLKSYWMAANAWDKTFRGEFQVDGRRIVTTPYCATNSPPIIKRNYRVLPLRGAIGIMKVSLTYHGERLEGIVGIMGHFEDPLAKRKVSF
jgi:hypothetical protein